MPVVYIDCHAETVTFGKLGDASGEKSLVQTFKYGLNVMNETCRNEENDEPLMEMTTLRPKISKLPVTMYIDENGSYMRGGHAKYEKFDIVKSSSPITREFATITLADGDIIFNPRIKKSDMISRDEIRAVRNFITNNRYALELLADEKIDFLDFIELMIPGGEIATEERKQQLLIETDKKDSET